MEDFHSRHIPFKPSRVALQPFEKHPSLISERPLPREEIEKLITLPRNIEKDIYWNPNSNVNFHFIKILGEFSAPGYLGQEDND